MKYTKLESKDYAREHMRGIWAAALTPFTPDCQLDEAGFRNNLRHWRSYWKANSTNRKIKK